MAERTVRKAKCGTGKVAFQSQGEANRALARIALTEQQAAVHIETYPQRAYRCRCGKWHLTSQEQRTERQARERKPPKPRRARRKVKAKRHLTLAPALPAAKTKPTVEAKPVARVVDHTGPITDTRRARWAALEGERVQANLANPYPWKRAV